MNKVYFLMFLMFALLINVSAQNNFASEVIILNGENFGSNQSNIASYNLVSKTYTVFDTLNTSSVQDILIEDSIAFVAAESKILAYNLNTKTKIAEVAYPGVSPNKNSLFTDNNNIYLGNWYGQTDSFLYAFDKSTLTFEYAVTEANTECGGGLSLNDTLYIGQKIKGTIDGCAPFGCFEDTLGAIIIADANTGNYIRTITLGEAGSGIEQIYNEGNYLFAVCPTANKIIKIEIATDSIIEEISLAPFTQSLQKVGSKLYLDLNGKAGFYDLADGSTAFSALDLAGSALAYDPVTETAFSTTTDFFSFGNLAINNTTTNDTITTGISPEAIALFYIENAAPIAVADEYNYIYDENTASYILDVLANDSDPDGGNLNITSISNLSVPGATASIVNNKIEYNRAAGIATTDEFTYQVCDDNNTCTSATVKVILKSVLAIGNIEKNDFSIYPNPVEDYLYIDTNKEIESIYIIDLAGKAVKITKLNKINLHGITKGIYFVSVKTISGVFTKKITVK
ncbi:MAG: Ig-like domain-containing protein [Chitinophagales bacterium]